MPGPAIYTDDGAPGRGIGRFFRRVWRSMPPTPPPVPRLINSGGRALGSVIWARPKSYPGPDTLAAFVTGFYQHALRRAPSAAEVAGWVSFLQADPTPARVRVMTHAFFDGPEYRARPVTPESHVTALY